MCFRKTTRQLYRKIIEQENLNNHLIGVSCGKCDNTAGGV